MTGAIVAATSTNLAAVLPFLFIGGLIRLLFRELIFTISAAILASLLVPALAGHVPVRQEGAARRLMNRGLEAAQNGYGRLLERLLSTRRLAPVIAAFGVGLALTVPDPTRPGRSSCPS